MRADLPWNLPIAVAIVLSLFAAMVASGAARANDSASCQALEGVDFQDIQDAPTQVMKARLIEAAVEVPMHCHVEGYVAPNIGIVLELPTTGWNGKLIEMAPGGQGGSTDTMTLWCNDALRRGYVCLTHDTGHKSTSGDSLWAYNNLPALIDYAIRSSHAAVLSGKSITRHYYGTSPKFSYFQGCSGGGQKALVEAQRFPWDFDGIISLDPATNLVGTTDITLLWNALAIHDANGNPLFTPADIDLLHNAVLAKCDSDDGLKDGIIGDPRACKFDTAVLTCKAGQKSGCLSPAQVQAANKVYSGPVTSTGEKLFHGSLPGSEKGVFGFGASAWYKENFFRYLAFLPPAGPQWSAKQFDFDRDYKRSGVMAAISAADNPDLRKLRAAGGKLMIVADLDSSGSPLPWATIDYYEMVAKLMGGPKETQKFVRLFALPGVAHCGGGPGANAFDYLSSMEEWVERGRPPEVMIGAHVEGAVVDSAGRESASFIHLPTDLATTAFTRPAYPYPLQARYRGHGDPNDYRSFVAVAPKAH